MERVQATTDASGIARRGTSHTHKGQALDLEPVPLPPTSATNDFPRRPAMLALSTPTRVEDCQYDRPSHDEPVSHDPSGLESPPGTTSHRYGHCRQLGTTDACRNSPTGCPLEGEGPRGAVGSPAPRRAARS